HDSASPRRPHDGERPFCSIRGRHRPDSSQVCIGRERRSDDGNRADAADARRPARGQERQITVRSIQKDSTMRLTYQARAAALSVFASALVCAGASAQQDPRVGLKAGLYDSGEASWNMKKLVTQKPSVKFVGSTNSD